VTLRVLYESIDDLMLFVEVLVKLQDSQARTAKKAAPESRRGQHLQLSNDNAFQLIPSYIHQSHAVFLFFQTADTAVIK
jgi:hypothetical protein